jgi:ubiquinone/menaquinone biosynthesis C-methylase UbiE
LVTSVVIAASLAPVGRAQSAAQNAIDAERLVGALALQAGQTVCEIGAGEGELTVALGRVVGETGHVLSNDLNPKMLASLRKAVEGAGLHNVTIVEGREKETNFPDAACDAVFMRDVYHHFGDPPAMNASIRQSLKVGGRLAIIDFTPPPGGENPPGKRGLDNHHGITAPTLERELQEAHFEIVSSTTPEPRSIFVVARRPN